MQERTIILPSRLMPGSCWPESGLRCGTAVPAPRQEPVFELDTLKMDFEKRKVSVRGEEVHLTPIEYKMLSLLVNNSGKVLTHHYIQQEVWGYDTTDDYQSFAYLWQTYAAK